MKRFYRGVWLCAFVAAMMSGSVNAAPFKIQNEQQAAAAWWQASAFHISIESEVTRVPDLALRQVLRSLSDLEQVTSVGALISSRRGITVPCEFGGSFTARMPKARPGVLVIDWSACMREADEYMSAMWSGPVTLKMTNPTFTPESIESLRVGSKVENVVWTRNYPDPEYPQVYTEEFNFTMRGTIPTTRLFESGYFTGDADFVVHGSWSSSTEVLSDGYIDRVASTVDRARVNRSAVYSDNNTVLDRSFQLVRGGVTTRNEYPARGEVREHSFNAANFRARELTDFNDFVTVKQEVWIDGKLNYQHVQGYSPGCMSGDYVFKTRTPMTNLSLFTKQERDEGEVTMNNSTVRLYSASTVPPNLPTPSGNMLTVVDVKRIGLFSFDSDWTSPRAITALSQCY